MNIFRKILSALPLISVGMDDLHLHVTVGAQGLDGRNVGFTVGPRFLSLDVDGDIARQLISPPEGYEAPISDYTFDWNSKEGLTYIGVPAAVAKRFGWQRIPGTSEWDKAEARLAAREENTDAYTDTEREGGWTSVGVSTPQDGPFVGEEEPEPSTTRFVRNSGVGMSYPDQAGV